MLNPEAFVEEEQRAAVEGEVEMEERDKEEHAASVVKPSHGEQRRGTVIDSAVAAAVKALGGEIEQEASGGNGESVDRKGGWSRLRRAQ